MEVDIFDSSYVVPVLKFSSLKISLDLHQVENFKSAAHGSDGAREESGHWSLSLPLSLARNAFMRPSPRYSGHSDHDLISGL